MRVLASLIALIALLSVGRGILSYRARVARESARHASFLETNSNPILMPCGDAGAEMKVTFPGSVLLNESFAPSGDIRQFGRQAILDQLRYLSGYFNNSLDLRGNRVFLSAQDAEIKITEIQKTRYEMNLQIDPVGPKEDFEYVNRALARGETQAEDPAWKIFYQATIEIAACNATTVAQSLSKLSLPMDPYLAYWFVPTSKRQSITYQVTTSVANPCASAEIASLNRPSYYWFVWDPYAKSCGNLLASGRELGVFEPHFERKSSGAGFILGEPLTRKKGILHATMFFSPLEVWTIPFDAQVLFRAFESQDRSLVDLVDEFLKNQGQAHVRMDAGVFGFLAFLRRLASTEEILNHRISVGANHVLLELSLRLKESQRQIALRLYFGTTDASGASIPDHWPILLSSFAHDDFIAYLGHAGLGTNLRLQKMTSDLGLSPETITENLSKKDYQLIAMLTCNAYTYFGRDILSARRLASKKHRSQLRSDLMLMASSDYQYKPYFYFGLIQYLDELLSGKHSSLGGNLESYFSPNDMIVFESESL